MIALLAVAVLVIGERSGAVINEDCFVGLPRAVQQKRKVHQMIDVIILKTVAGNSPIARIMRVDVLPIVSDGIENIPCLLRTYRYTRQGLLVSRDDAEGIMIIVVGFRPVSEATRLVACSGEVEAVAPMPEKLRGP